MNEASPIRSAAWAGPQRKPGGRERLLTAAAEAFLASGYFAVSVEEISAAAGVSRMTFYRHFTGKPEIAAELCRENAATFLPNFLDIAQHSVLNHIIVAQWIGRLFEASRASAQLLTVFSQATAETPAFAEAAQGFFARLIADLGKTIPAFALDPDSAQDRSRWLEAWLLLYEIMDQGNHAARGLGVASDPRVIGLLAQRCLRFVRTGESGFDSGQCN